MSARPRAATTGVFFVHGAVIGTFVARIPYIQERFDLSESAVGLLLVSMSAAVVAALPVAGQAIARHGSRRVTLIGGVAYALAVNLPVLAPDPVLVAASLLVLGGASATTDVAMNSHGVSVERDLDRPVMSSLHAGWSLGGMTGAGFAALVTAVGVDARAGVALASLLALAAVVACVSRMGPGLAGEGDEAPTFALPTRPVLLLALLCLVIMLVEGAMADWGGLYMRADLGAAPAVAALAFAAFTAGMTVGRVFGDAMNRHMGPVTLMRGGAVLAGVPLAAMLAIGEPGAALAGMFLVGIGVANGVPLLFSAAGRRTDAPSGPSIAAVSSMGSLGFLAGPPLIGFLADAISLPWALATLLAGPAAVLLLARRALGGPQATQAAAAAAAAVSPAGTGGAGSARSGGQMPR